MNPGGEATRSATSQRPSRAAPATMTPGPTHSWGNETGGENECPYASDDHAGHPKGSSTTLSTASETSEGSFLPSLSQDSDTSKGCAYCQTPPGHELLRHRRDPVNALSPTPPDGPPPSHEHGGARDHAGCAKAHQRYRLGAALRLPRLLLLVLLTAFLLAGRFYRTQFGANPRLRWRIPLSRRQVRTVLRRIARQHRELRQQQPLELSPSPSFTILLRGGRVDLLHQSLDRHAACPGVAAVRIDWQRPEEEEVPEGLFRHPSGKVTGPGAYRTDAVLLLGEHLQFDCRELARAHHEWLRDPARAVGLRAATDGRHVLASDAAVFVHRLLLAARPRGEAAAARGGDSDGDDDCREFVFSAVLAKASGKPAISIVSRPHQLAAFRRAAEQDATCVSELARTFGLKPAEAYHHYVGR